MKKKEITKQMLKNHSCNNCDNRTMDDEEMSNYKAQWNEDPPFDWCRFRKNHPKENTCNNWTDDFVENPYDEIEFEEYEDLMLQAPSGVH